MLNVADLGGRWRRSLLALPDGTRDTTSVVTWLQAGTLYADLRQPAPMPDFSHARGLDDLTEADCAWLARQLGFAGELRPVDDCFEWVRRLDFQPKGKFADIGRLFWDGGVLVEEGRDVAYVEHWHRDILPKAPIGALQLTAPEDGAPGCLLRVGGDFIYARGRPAALPAAEDLGACLAATAGLAARRRLIDCEISAGTVAGTVWRIGRSTLPYRVGDDLAPRARAGEVLVADRAPDGWPMVRRWTVAKPAGDISSFIDVSA